MIEIRFPQGGEDIGACLVMKRMRRGGKDSQGIERVLKMSMLGWMLVLGTVCVPSGNVFLRLSVAGDLSGNIVLMYCL